MDPYDDMLNKRPRANFNDDGHFANGSMFTCMDLNADHSRMHEPCRHGTWEPHREIDGLLAATGDATSAPTLFPSHWHADRPRVP